MKNWIFKFFLWYSKKLGYEVTILKEENQNYESYQNYASETPDRQKELEQIADQIVVHTYVDPTIAKKKSQNKMANPIRQINTDQLAAAGGLGAAKMLTRKVNELVTIINIINRDRYLED